MSFTRVMPSGWAFGAKLTSAQQNQLDIDHANSLDKSIAGDALQGIVTMATTAAIRVNTAGAQIAVSVANGLLAQVPSAVVATTNNAIVSHAPNGGFSLQGGAGDNPNYIPSRLISRGRPFRPATVVPAAWSASTQYYLVGGGTTGFIFCALDGLIDVSVIASVTVQFLVGGTHAGGVGGGWVAPKFSVFRQPIGNGNPLGLQTLNSGDSGGGLSPAPSSGASWHNGGNIQGFQYTVDQNEIIDRENYVYGIAVQDENGPNSSSGNAYFATVSSMFVSQLNYD